MNPIKQREKDGFIVEISSIDDATTRMNNLLKAQDNIREQLEEKKDDPEWRRRAKKAFTIKHQQYRELKTWVQTERSNQIKEELPRIDSLSEAQNHRTLLLHLHNYIRKHFYQLDDAVPVLDHIRAALKTKETLQ